MYVSITAILTLDLGFSLDESHIFCIQSTRTVFFLNVATNKPMRTHASEFFLATRSHLMTLREDLAFSFIFLN
jgi:hypothetical protein